ncbi:MAG: zinc dependent phospholipase C family protein [Gemmatimonadetes bacterium]|nr:zinc dependent phospholipase C family protein [Gemmatimonadota bacterium]
MPSLTLHLVFADLALSAAQEASEPTLRGIASAPELRSAFRQGAWGPDLGYFPGGERFLSDLAHCVHTGSLNRALYRQAQSERERAFALGWLTHVLADRLVHPAVGRACGELLYGAPDVFVDGGTEPVAHVRVETGLDAWFAVRNPPQTAPSCRFGAPSLRFLARAYQGTYGIRPGVRPVQRSYGAIVRSACTGLRLIRWLGRVSVPDGPAAGRPAPGPRLFPMASAFLTPVLPSPWLVDAVQDAFARFPALFLAHAANGLEELDDANLETGEPESQVRDHPNTAVTLRRLREMRAAAARGRKALDVRTAIPAPASAGP